MNIDSQREFEATILDIFRNDRTKVSIDSKDFYPHLNNIGIKMSVEEMIVRLEDLEERNIVRIAPYGDAEAYKQHGARVISLYSRDLLD